MQREQRLTKPTVHKQVRLHLNYKTNERHSYNKNKEFFFIRLLYSAFLYGRLEFNFDKPFSTINLPLKRVSVDDLCTYAIAID